MIVIFSFIWIYVTVSALAAVFGLAHGGASGSDNQYVTFRSLYMTPFQRIWPWYGLFFVFSYWLFGGRRLTTGS